MDVALALVGLACSAPLWVILAAGIKLTDGGSVFYTQDRVGMAGRPFGSRKFRSMSPLESREGPPCAAGLETNRITGVGRLMRATALDELPQLWSILIGDMSFVGPRALLPEEVVKRGEDMVVVRMADVVGYVERQSVLPGLTGLSQLHLPRTASHRDKFRVDRIYVRRRSLALDLRLFIASVWVSVRGRWPTVGAKRL